MWILYPRNNLYTLLIPVLLSPVMFFKCSHLLIYFGWHVLLNSTYSDSKQGSDYMKAHLKWPLLLYCPHPCVSTPSRGFTNRKTLLNVYLPIDAIEMCVFLSFLHLQCAASDSPELTVTLYNVLAASNRTQQSLTVLSHRWCCVSYISISALHEFTFCWKEAC